MGLTEVHAPTERRRRRRRRWTPTRAWRRWKRTQARREAFGDGTSRRQRRRRRRLVIAVVSGLGVATVLVGAFLFAVWHDVDLARDDLSRVRASLAAARTPGVLESPEGRAQLLRRLQLAEETVTGTGRQLLDSRALSLAGALPGVRSQRSGLLQLVGDAAEATRAARAAMSGFDAVASRSSLRDGVIPLDSLAGLLDTARQGETALAPLVRGASGLWGPLGDARRDFDEIVGSTAARLGGGADALTATLTFFGTEADRRYFLAFQNNAEMRAQGMVLSYGVLRFSGGRFELERTGSIADLTLAATAPTPIPPGTQDVFGALFPTRTWQSVNLTADFAFSGAAMAAMYRQATGTPVDGVIALDVPGLAKLLEVIGPVQMAGIAEPVTSTTAGRILLHDQYEGLPPLSDPTADDRRDRLADLAREVVARLASGSRDPVTLGRTLSDAAAGGHLRVWSADPDEERLFESAGLGGGPAREAADRTFHLTVQNRTATKLDYYVKPVVHQQVRLTDDGDAVVRTTVRLENRAPVGAAPSYQLGPDRFTKDPGDYLGWLLLWSPAGSEQPAGTVESALVLSQHVSLVKAGQTSEFTFQETRIPDAVRDGRLMLRLVPQPRLEPADLRVTVSAGRWDVRGDTDWSGRWDRTMSLSWEIRD